MSSPAILFDDVPKVNYWGSTAPPESTDEDNDNIVQSDDCEGGNGDDEAAMETIFADPCMDYVMVPSSVPDTDDSLALMVQPNTRPRGDSTLQLLLKRFSKTYSSWYTKLYSHWKKDEQSPALSSSASHREGRVKRPYHGRTRGSNIYSSYDWVSEVEVDDEGRRLILPGQLVVLDSEPTSMTPVLSNYSSTSEETDELPSQFYYAASLFGSSTIMVSAHDLLSTRSNNKSRSSNNDDGLFASACGPLDEDFDCFSEVADQSTSGFSSKTSSRTTSSASIIVTKALWKLASRKYKSAQDMLLHSSSVLVNSLTRRLAQVEQHLEIFSKTSDLILQGYECYSTLLPLPSSARPVGTLAASWKEEGLDENLSHQVNQGGVLLELANRDGNSGEI
eukprot:scaffold7755_cov104-Cylindrotheca_fusiformis.AAC.17